MVCKVTCFTLKIQAMTVTPGKYLETDWNVFDWGIPPQITQTFLRTSLLLACYFLNVLSCSENVFTGGYICSCVNDWKYSVCCSWCLIKDDWKLSYWSSFVGGIFTCKWLQETQGVCLMCNVNSMLLAEASVYTHTVFFQWVNWNQSLYTWICIVCLWTN